MELFLNILVILLCGILFSGISCVITASIIHVKTEDSKEILRFAIIAGTILFVGVAVVNQRKLDNIERTVKSIVRESETLEDAQAQIEEYYE